LQLGRIRGSIVATRKPDALQGVRLVVIEPLNSELEVTGPAIAAIDVVYAGLNDIIYWVGSREAAFATEAPHSAVDAAVVGIVDRVDLLRDRARATEAAKP
jgi:ethanolamine utilization protein EutN